MAETRNTIRWDSVGADKVKRDYAEVQSADAKTADGFKRTGGAASQAGDGITRLGTSARDYAAHANVAATASNTLGVGLAALARYASAGALLELGRRTVLAADSFKGLQNQLRVAGFESDALASATDRLFQISNRTKTSIEANATLYGRLSSVQGELGASSEQLFVFTEAVGNALKINNTEAAAAQGALLQLSQAMGGAKIQAQEFNSLIDGMRPLLQAAAKYIDGAGGSVSKLQQMVRDGELSNKAFFDGILKGSKDLEAQAAKAQTGISQSLVVMKNNFIEAAGKSEELTAVSNMTATAIETLGKNMGEAARLAGEAAAPFVLVASAIGGMGSATNDFLAQYPALREALKDLTSNGGFLNLIIPGQISDMFKSKPAAPPQSEMGGAAAAAYVGRLRYGGAVPLPTDKPDSGRVELTKAEIAKRERELAKAAENEKDWQDKLAVGWITVYEKVGEASEDFYRQVAKDAKEAGEAEDKAYRERRANINEVIADIELETRLMGMSNDERERTIALLKLEKENANADDIAKLDAVLNAKKIAEAAKKAADEVEAIWTNAAHDVNDAWSDFLFDIFDKGKFKFGDFAKSLKSIWARTIADMIALSTQQSIVAPLFSALFGREMPGVAGSTGAAGTLDVFGWLTGKSQPRMGGATVQDAMNGGLSVANGGAGGFVAGAGAGGMLGTISSGIGGIFASLGMGKMFGSATGGLIGGTLGGAAGGVLGVLGGLGAAAGPIGMIAGAILGGLLGGVLKPTPRSISSVTTTSSGAGVIGDSFASGLDIKIGKDMANGVIRALSTFADELATGLESDRFLGMVGQRGKKYFFQSQQSDIKSAGKSKYGAVKFEEAEDAIAYAIEAAINSGVVKGLTDSDKKLMRAATSVEQAMQDVVASHDFKRELGFQFAGLTSPLAEAQARLEYEYQQQLLLADKYEADKTKLEAIYAQKRLDLVKQYNDQQNAAMEQSLGGLKAYLFDLTGGSASPLSPTNRLNLAQSNYNDIRKRALAGDTNAIGQLQSASQDFLSASQSVFGSTAGFQANYQNVVATLAQVTGSANPLAAANQNTAAAVNDNTRIQAAAAERAYNQRNQQTALLQSIDAKLSASASAAQRGSPAPTQNGVVPVGTVDFAAIQQAVAGIRW